MISSVADLASPPHPLMQLSAAPFIAPVTGAYLRTGRADEATTWVSAARRQARARRTAERRTAPVVGLTTQICWWAALATGLTCSIVPIVSRGSLVAWIAAVATLGASTALCLAGALQVGRGERLDSWTGLMAGAGAAFALTQAADLIGVVSRAGIAPSARLEVIGLFLLSTVYAAMATAGAWTRDLNSKVVTR